MMLHDFCPNFLKFYLFWVKLMLLSGIRPAHYWLLALMIIQQSCMLYAVFFWLLLVFSHFWVQSVKRVKCFMQNAWWLDLGRLSVGFGVGIICYVVPVYIAEITPTDLRGRFTSATQIWY
ncbi:sugar transporter ERD6-like 11 [Rosa chinensis]|uniref:sugar transporter ERD6-like 11 n=1 Tax=Rosa chinensis TaxID=74649 RepID=UPI001AD8F52C|nr:sugar transporter ERD6-like 11 [Rosa chinensis]